MSDFNLQTTLGSLISKTKWYLNTYITKKIKEAGLKVTHEQWVILIIISSNPGIYQTEIAEKGLKDKTNVTRMLDILEREKYLIRKKDEHDRRMYRIYLTTKGEEILEQMLPIVRDIDNEINRDLSQKETEVLKEYLGRICKTFRELL